MGFVSVFGVVGCEVDVPATVERVKLWSPEVAGIGGVWWRSPVVVRGRSSTFQWMCLREGMVLRAGIEIATLNLTILLLFGTVFRSRRARPLTRSQSDLHT